MKPSFWKRVRATLGIIAATAGGATWVNADVIGQWDFEQGNLAATVGDPLDYADGNGGETQQQTRFGTTTSLGIPDINGEAARVMGFPASFDPMGYWMPVNGGANGGGQLMNQWTLILDVLYPEASDNQWRAFIETDLGFVNPDAELFVNTANGIGISGQYDGEVIANQWHRIAFVIDQSNAANQIRKYIDGVEVGVQGAGALDGRWALTPNSIAVLFSDDDSDNAPGYANSIQLHNAPLSRGQIAALGGPTADGIPRELPAVPSFVEKWIPAGSLAARNSRVGTVINEADAAIQDNSIVLKLDDQTLANPTIARDGDRITVSTDPGDLGDGALHRLEVAYTEQLEGESRDRSASTQFTSYLFAEDFESLELGPNVDEGLAGAQVWTKTPPEDWEIDDSQMSSIDDPDSGVTEWEGWSFADRLWWTATAGDQNRSQFTKGVGTVAIADPDEWDDKGSPVATYGYFNSFLTTAPIPVDELAGATASLRFSSSWRPECCDDAGPDGEQSNNQTATVTVSFDGGAPVEILHWDSESGSPTFHPDSENETVDLEFAVPAGAASAMFTFGLTNAGNDWWWAFDDVILTGNPVSKPDIVSQPQSREISEGGSWTFAVEVRGTMPFAYQWYRGTGAAKAPIENATGPSYTVASATADDAGVYSVTVSNDLGETPSDEVRLSVVPPLGRVLLAEDFESVPLGPNVDEAPPADGRPVWTKTPPDGWSIDDSGMPGMDDPELGVTEWKGWSFADRIWWATVAGDQRRSEFWKSTGVAAIADPDEWDDKGSPAGVGTFNSFLISPAIDVSNVPADGLVMRFNSSWRPEGNQTATVTVSYDGGAEQEVLRWNATSDDKTNETIDLALANPAGAQQAVIRFGMTDAVNNWFWAIDNIQVADSTAQAAELTISLDGNQVTIAWTGGGTLQMADKAEGPYSDVNGASSPHRTDASAAAAFYRVAQ